jgi:hypothetical protein
MSMTASRAGVSDLLLVILVSVLLALSPLFSRVVSSKWGCMASLGAGANALAWTYTNGDRCVEDELFAELEEFDDQFGRSLSSFSVESSNGRALDDEPARFASHCWCPRCST